jgi:hypothetical protein
MFETINRAALYLAPRKPMVDWIKEIMPGNTTDLSNPLEHDNGRIYLVPEFEDAQELINWLKKNYEPIFENELFFWCTNPEYWPGNRSWEKFIEWQYISFQSMVIDSLGSRIMKDQEALN